MKNQKWILFSVGLVLIAGSAVLMNYALWESVAHFRAAFNHPEFKQSLEQYPASTVASPHLFTRLSVSNLCVGP